MILTVIRMAVFRILKIFKNIKKLYKYKSDKP